MTTPARWPPMSEQSSSTSNIYDLGYRHYEGQRIGRRGTLDDALRARAPQLLRARAPVDQQGLSRRTRDLRLRACRDPARRRCDPERARARDRALQARGLLHLRAHHPRSLLRRGRAGARRARPAKPHALPLLLAGRLAFRLHDLEVRGADDGHARAHARAAAAAVHRQRHGGRRPSGIRERRTGISFSRSSQARFSSLP